MTDSAVLAKAIVVQTQEEERYRLARLIQAGPAQLLANAILEIDTYLQLMDEQPATARIGLTALLMELKQGLDDVRGLIAELQPPLLDELGLAPSLKKYTDDFSKQTGIAIQLVGWELLTERLPATMEVAIFRIVQEALENIRKHAHATHAELKFEPNPNQLVLVITDDGKGFELGQGIIPGRRLGLVAMRDRAELLGGNLQIFTEPGHGVRVVLTAPMRTLIPSS